MELLEDLASFINILIKNMNKNYILLGIRSFIFSPLSPLFLSILINIMINSSNNVYILCDGQSIEEMKETLDLLINKYKESNFYYEYWKDRTDEEEMSEFIEDCRKKAKEKF